MRRSTIWLLWISIFFPAISFAQEEQKIEKPDKQVLLWKLPATGSKALIPDISLIGSIAGAWFRDDPVGDQGENPGRTGFNLQGIELAIQSVVDPYIRGDIFLHFDEDGVEVEEAVITTLSLPWNMQVRAGKLLARFGRLNTHHVEQWDFVDSALPSRYFFGPEGFKELGAELSVLFPTKWFSELSFAFLQGENEGNFDGPRKGDFVYLGHWKNGFDLSPNIAGQVGLSGAIGFNGPAEGNTTQMYGADFFLRWKPSERRGLKWQTEYFLRRREEVLGTTSEGGLYSQLVYQFAKRWEAGIRGERVGLPEEIFGQWGFAPQVTFLATEFFHLRGEYHFVTTDDLDRPQHEGFLQLVFNMGVHGAHIF